MQHALGRLTFDPWKNFVGEPKLHNLQYAHVCAKQLLNIDAYQEWACSEVARARAAVMSASVLDATYYTESPEGCQLSI